MCMCVYIYACVRARVCVWCVCLCVCVCVRVRVCVVRVFVRPFYQLHPRVFVAHSIEDGFERRHQGRGNRRTREVRESIERLEFLGLEHGTHLCQVGYGYGRLLEGVDRLKRLGLQKGPFK